MEPFSATGAPRVREACAHAFGLAVSHGAEPYFAGAASGGAASQYFGLASTIGILDSALKKRFLALLIYGVFVSRAAYAQQVPVAADDPVANARFRFGVVALTPRFGIRDVGVDTNVFNEVTNPKRDFTFTLSPGTNLWMRTGKGLLSASGNLDLVYFNRYSSERSINSAANGRYEIRFNRIRPYFSAGTANMRTRPGFEIDKRVKHYEADFHSGTDVRVASKGTVRLDYRHWTYDIADDEIFNGRRLSDQLNRKLSAFEGGWRQRLTALTTFVTRVSREDERFTTNSQRNNSSFRLTSGFELGQLALIRGSAFVGYRRLAPNHGGTLPNYSGLVADINAAYTAPTQTRIALTSTRDIEYSYENVTPYYLQTGWMLTLTQRLIGRWDAQGTGGRAHLAFQANDLTNAGRIDYVNSAGGGLGFSMNEQVRVGLDIRSFWRTSNVPGHDYDGVRAGVSVTYGY